MKKKILILGAGPSSLVAAYKLLKDSNNYDITILEKEKEIGGLCKTVDFKKNKIDYGVHFYRISEYKEVNDLIFNLIPIEDKLPTELSKKERTSFVKKNKNRFNEDNIMMINKVSSNIYFDNKFYDYPIKINMDTIKKMGFINLIKIGFSYLRVLIHKVEENNLENYYINRYGKKFYEMFFLEYTKKICGVHPKDIDIDWGKQRIRETSLINIVKEKIIKNKKVNNEPSLINEYYYPKYGCGEVYKNLEEEIIKKGGKILTNSYVKDIEVEDYKIKNVTYYDNKKQKNIKPDYLISSIPLGEITSLFKGNCLNNKVIKYAKDLPFRDLILVNLICSRKDIEHLENYKTIKKDSWVFIQDPKIKFGRIKVANNWSEYMIDKDKVLLTLEYCCDNKDEFCKLNKEKLEKKVKQELKLLHLLPKKIEDIKVIKVKNAYPAYYKTYKNRKDIINYLNKYKNMYFIGRAGQHQYIDMDKAMYTGLKAVEDLNKKGNKKDVWL